MQDRLTTTCLMQEGQANEVIKNEFLSMFRTAIIKYILCGNFFISVSQKPRIFLFDIKINKYIFYGNFLLFRHRFKPICKTNKNHMTIPTTSVKIFFDVIFLNFFRRNLIYFLPT